MSPDKTIRRGTVSVISEGRGRYSFQVSGDLDALEWVWVLEHAKRRVMSEPPHNVVVPVKQKVGIEARRVG